jgi:pimeloyl-ACP methyl ester carboxylesterase
MPEPSTVVFLPGLLCDGSIFVAQRAALEPYLDVAVADFSEHASLEGMARGALALRDGPLAVIGHSMGARVAFEMIRLAPDRVARLCLMDTGAHSRRAGEELQRQALVDLAYEQGMAALADRWLPPMVHEDRIREQALMEPLRAMVMRASPEQHKRQIRALLARPDARPLLPTITCPTLVMVGRQDRWSPVSQNEEVAGSIPGAEFLVIEGSGHMLPAEQPDEVSRALLQWLGLPRADQGSDEASGG